MKLSKKPGTAVRTSMLYSFSRRFDIIISLCIESLVLPRVRTSMLPAAISQAVWLTRRRIRYATSPAIVHTLRMVVTMAQW